MSEKTSQKTLRYILDDEVVSHIDFDLPTEDIEKEEMLNDLVKAVAKWLQFKLDFYKSFHGHTCDNSERILLLKNLLKELKKKEG